MTKQVYKLPKGVDVDFMRTLKGVEGSYLNPIEDKNGNFIISQEEYKCAEFQYLVELYPEVYAAMQLIPFEPIPEPILGEEI